MFKTLKNAFGLPDLRKKMLYTIFILLIFRIGSQIFVPYVDSSAIQLWIDTAAAGSIFGYLNLLSGSAFSQATLFALSVSPYITASIVIQLLTVAIPALERMAKEGQEGQKKLTQITRAVTVVLGLITAIGYYMFMRNNYMLYNRSVFAAIVIIACYSAGASLIMWLAEKINENGIGNGISLILLINILSRGGAIVNSLINSFNSVSSAVFAIIAVVISLGMIVFIVFMTNSERKLPIQYAKRVVGRKMYGGQSSTLPIKLNMSGVLPIIFAQSIVALPSTLALFFPSAEPGTFMYGFLNLFSTKSWFYAVLYFILIIAFSYFYIAISFNPVEVANNLQSNGGVIPGIRQGRPTAEYITKILNRITLIGAIFLGIIAVLPIVASIVSNGQISSELAFGGSSIIIVVGVILETVREIEAQMTMRHYKGFLE